MFLKINKFNKPLARLTKKRERTQVNKIRNERITTDTTEIIKKIIRENYEQLYANKVDNPEKMDTFLEEYSPLKLSQEETVNLNRPVTRSEIESN